MKEINLEELKNIELNMLIDFAKFCDDNNFTYYLFWHIYCMSSDLQE